MTNSCCCPKINARSCYRWRYKIDLAELLGDDVDDDSECECACHEDEDDWNALDDQDDDEPPRPAIT